MMAKHRLGRWDLVNFGEWFCFKLSFVFCLLFSGILGPSFAWAAHECQNLFLPPADPPAWSKALGGGPSTPGLQQLTNHFQKLIARLEKDHDSRNYIREVLSPARSIAELNALAYQERILRAFVRSKDFSELHLKISPEQNKLLVDYALKFNEVYLRTLANCLANLDAAGVVPWKLSSIQTPVGPIPGLELTITAQDTAAISEMMENVKVLQPIHYVINKLHKFWQEHGVRDGRLSLIYADLDLAYLQHEQQFGIFDQHGVASYQDGKIFLPYNIFANQFLAVPLLDHEFSHYQRDGRSFYIKVNPRFDSQNDTIIAPGYPKHLDLSEIHAYAAALSIINLIKPTLGDDDFETYRQSGMAQMEQEFLQSLRLILPAVQEHLASAKVVLQAMPTDRQLFDDNFDYKKVNITAGQQDLHHAQERLEIMISYPVMKEVGEQNYRAQFFILHFPYNLTQENADTLHSLKGPQAQKEYLRQVVSQELDHYLGLAQLFGQGLTSAQEVAKFWEKVHPELNGPSFHLASRPSL